METVTGGDTILFPASRVTPVPCRFRAIPGFCLAVRQEMPRPKKSTGQSPPLQRRECDEQSQRQGSSDSLDVLVAKPVRTKQWGAMVSITTEKRAPLPKGYAAYESEVHARLVCLERAGETSVEARKDGQKQDPAGAAAAEQRELESSKKIAIKEAAEDKEADGPAKLAKLKQLTGLRKLEWAKKS